MEKTEAGGPPPDLGDERYTRRKNRVKRVRVLLQIAVLSLVVLLLVHVFFTLRTYEPYDPELAYEGSAGTGFVALSYFGVDRAGDTSTLIGEDRLREHLQALRDQGYVTITQDDILAYYSEGRPLPRRALFLMFEDGRRDTAIFAQTILEDLNYKATMMTYAGKLGSRDYKFLSARDLKELEASSYWEQGTNGFRLEYINVFDRYGRYIGEIDPLRYEMLRPYLSRRYNHYLMDYLRDKHDVPRESYEHMKQRISYDYERLRDVYTEELGAVPRASVLMHGNTGAFGNNRSVSAVNERWLRELFRMNFNREGYCCNRQGSSLYDLTRMQPQPYWPVNHLLMRIKYDVAPPGEVDEELQFVTGDGPHLADWELLEGAGEMRGETYTLTTLPEGRALARLKEGEFRDMQIRIRLRGNAFGRQQLYLRASEDLKSFVRVELTHDQLVVTDASSGREHELYREKLSRILGEEPISVEEDRQAAEVAENEAFARYARSPEEGKEYLERAKARGDEHAPTVAEGAAPYEAELSTHKRSDHELLIDIHEGSLNVKLDDKPAAEGLTLAQVTAGQICLAAQWGDEHWSQRNLEDDVYDAVFDKFCVRESTGKRFPQEKMLYTMEYTGLAKYEYRAREAWEAVLRWFMNYL